MRKAQVSVEMVILLSALLIIVMGIISTFSSASDRTFLSRRTVSAREISEKLAYGINNAHLAGEGADTVVVLPSTLIDSTDYSITIYPYQHLLEISWKARQDVERHQVPILTAQLGGKLSGINGSVTLSNVNGTVVITD